MTALPRGARATPLGRVLTALELALADEQPAPALDELLGVLGVPVDLPPDRVDLAGLLVELAEDHHRLSTEGTAAVPEDLPPSVDRTRWLDAELDRLAGDLEALVRLIAATLR